MGLSQHPMHIIDRGCSLGLCRSCTQWKKMRLCEVMGCDAVQQCQLSAGSWAATQWDQVTVVTNRSLVVGRGLVNNHARITTIINRDNCGYTQHQLGTTGQEQPLASQPHSQLGRLVEVAKQQVKGVVGTCKSFATVIGEGQPSEGERKIVPIGG